MKTNAVNHQAGLLANGCLELEALIVLLFPSGLTRDHQINRVFYPTGCGTGDTFARLCG